MPHALDDRPLLVRPQKRDLRAKAGTSATEKARKSRLPSELRSNAKIADQKRTRVCLAFARKPLINMVPEAGVEHTT